MDNQYNYYQPNQGDSQNVEENTEQNTYQTGEDIYTHQTSGATYLHNAGGAKPQGPKKPFKFPKWAAVLCAAVLFGVVGGSVFVATSYVGNRILGNDSSKSVSTVQATTVTSDGNTTSEGSDVTKVANNVMPSVVSITNMSVQQVQNFFGGAQQQEVESAGSGIIIGQNDTELLILTNNHVVDGSETLTVSFTDEESVSASIKGTDAEKDLAVIAVKISDIKESTMGAIKVATLGDSTKLEVGQQVIAIGNALGYGQSVTTGIVSATDRTLEGMEGFTSKLIQTDAAINPGNSGGALVNASGEVIGINTAKVSSSAVEGMGYAIPISDATETINSLMNQETKEKVAESERGYIGIQGVSVTTESAQMYNMPTGVYVSEVIKGGGAEAASVPKGSVITKLDETTVDSMDTLQKQLQYYGAGTKVKLTVAVQGSNGEYTEKEYTVTLTKQN